VATALATLTLHLACSINLLEFSANVMNALDETATIDFELGLAGTAGANATRLLGERSAGSSQARQPVLQ
jgi:hypothetical protein